MNQSYMNYQKRDSYTTGTTTTGGTANSSLNSSPKNSKQSIIHSNQPQNFTAFEY